MTRNRKLILWLLSGFVILLIIALASFVIWRVNLTNEINAKLAEIRAAGLPTNGKALNIYYPAVPNDENAALGMIQTFGLMQNFSDGRSNEVANFKIQPRNQRLTAEQKKIFSEYVEMNAEALAKMHKAIELPASRYPVDYTPEPNTRRPHLSKLHNLSEIIRYQSLLASESGDMRNVVASIENLLGMAHTLNEEPDLIAQLVRISLIAIAESSLEHCLNITNLNEAALAELASDFSSAEKTNLMSRALAGELALNAPVFIQANRNANGASELVKGAKDAGETFSTSRLDDWLIPFPRFFQITGFWDRDLLYYLNVMETSIALDRFAPPRSLLAADNFKKAENEVEQNHYYLSKLFIEALPNAVINEAKSFVSLRTSITALAVERFRLAHGQLPDDLNQLVPQFLSAMPQDPFDGLPLHYHRLAKGYVIYSIGSDGEDNGGREKPDAWKSTDKTHCDLTFTVER